MKKLLIVAVALASVNAFATRARTTALGNSPHLVDTTTVYSNPAHIFSLGGDYVTIESGNPEATGATTSNGAEGMVVRSHGDSKFGIGLGHDSDNAIGLRNMTGSLISNDQTIAQQQNPVELTYGMKAGDMSWAGTLVYSNFKNKKADSKENSLGLRFGMLMGAVDAALRIGLQNEASNTTVKFKGTTGVGLDVGYQMDSIYLSGGLSMAGFKQENASSGAELTKFESTTLNVSATSEMKKDNNSFFYGAGLKKVDAKESVNDVKSTSLTLPVWMGLETAANSWLTVRGSISQSVLINDSKKEVAGATTAAGTEDFSPGANNTTAAMGVGLKLDKLTLDGTLKGLVGGTQSREISGNDLLAQVGATYMF